MYQRSKKPRRVGTGTGTGNILSALAGKDVGDDPIFDLACFYVRHLGFQAVHRVCRRRNSIMVVCAALAERKAEIFHETVGLGLGRGI